MEKDLYEPPTMENIGSYDEETGSIVVVIADGTSNRGWF
ncbi:hypothetical protein FB471_1018 [Amycolatopsis cihanbeyliensis]|uniref:Uncharacterized protein n=1 Tax=Amycolatopsis cihanbeyliensis TaxID=1128664 RepID=A0A542DE49_AMYCI|nr:hypothetical protein FB471_1018 [Amycolatopsis cihanbeyliensis]